MQTQLLLFDEPELVTFRELLTVARPVIEALQRAILDSVDALATYRATDPNFMSDEFRQFEAAQFLCPQIRWRSNRFLAPLIEKREVAVSRRKRIFSVTFRDLARFCVKKVDEDLQRRNASTPHNTSFWTQRSGEVLKVLLAYRLRDDLRAASTYLILPEGFVPRDYIALSDMRTASTTRPELVVYDPKTAETQRRGFRAKARKDAIERRQDADGQP